ncbi:uncharacterized protein [Panulirus ornatus]|uniref:uncharacterized protein n=1 Tax=Panulirus ornatus TaxID=150431 RepID=UPI003A8BD82B
MDDLLRKIGELDLRNQQKLLTAMVTNNPPEVQQALLLPTVMAASSYVKWRLATFLNGQDTPDLLVLLPPELQLVVLQYVDGTSLLNASQVSRDWNCIIKNHSKIWIKKCRELGVNVDKIKYDTNWHQIYVSSLRQKLSLKAGTAFTERFMQLQNCKKAVKAVDYQNGFLCTVSEEDYVNIWQLELNIPLLTFPVERAVSCIKFKPNSLLICGHFVGILTSWDLRMMSQLSCTVYNAASEAADENSLLRCKFKMHAGPVFSSDFNEDLGLLVSGGADECIKLWCLSTGLVVKSLPNQDHWVLRVILLSDLSCNFNHVIICMTRDNVSKISWPASRNRNSSPEVNSSENVTSDNSDPNSACFINRFGDLDKSSLKSFIRLNEGNNNFFTPGLQHSTKFVGLIKQDIDEKHANLCVYDIETFELLYNIILNFKVKKLLALGNRYALLLTIGNVLYSSTLIAVDIITGETAGTHAVPHSKMTTPDGAQLVVGDIDWLDGLGGQLPELKVPAISAETSGKSDNTESSVCSFNKESQENINKPSSVSSSHLGLKVYDQNRSPECGAQHHSTYHPNKGCMCKDSQGEAIANIAASGDMCMGNYGTDLHYRNNNDPAITSSDDLYVPETSLQPPSHTVHHTKETYRVKLERPGHLVLAAGVQSEPGRLFTLWWTHSKQTGKYKEE